MITITVPWEGKKFCVDRVLSSIGKLLIPDSSVQWVFIDNSGDRIFYDKLYKFLRSLPDSHAKKIVQVEPGRYKTSADLYNDLLPDVKGNWIALEDDITEIPEDIIYQFYREIYKTYDLSIIGANIQSRRGLQENLCWNIEYNGSYYDVVSASPGQSGFGYVDAIHTGCTLIRPSVYLGYKFQSIKQEKGRAIEHDIHIGLEAKRKGLKVGVLWDARPAHLTQRGPVFSSAINYANGITPSIKVSLPLVSIIVPTNDRPHLLSGMINQLKTQSYTQFECLICNDGPSYASAQVVEEANDCRFRYFELGFKHGFSGAPQRNAMLHKVGGELIVFVDDDVEVEDDYLQVMVALWKSGYLMGFAQIKHVDIHGEERVIPPDKESCIKLGMVDTLCFYVDSSIGKCFFWDLLDEHDYRYVQQVSSYLKGSYIFTDHVIGKSKRSYGHSKDSHEPTSAQELVQQLSRVLDRPSEEAEEIISKDATASLMYVMNVLNSSPWPKGEHAISQNINASLFYATNVLKGRFLEAEDLISKEPWSAKYYSSLVGKSWSEMGRPDVDTRLNSECEVV